MENRATPITRAAENARAVESKEREDARVEHVVAQNVRNYHHVDAALSPSWTLLVGPNGAGKTNFLEILTANLRGVRFRGGWADLLRWGTTTADIHTMFGNARTVGTRLALHPTGVSRTLLFNGAPRAVPEEAVPPLILFLPNEDVLLDHSAGRRQLLGRGLLLHSQRYLDALTQCRRLLRQRNTLLRAGIGRAPADEWGSWTEAIMEPMRRMWGERRRAVDHLNHSLPGALERLGGVDPAVQVDLRWGGIEGDAVPSLDALRRRFVELRHREEEQGKTLIGPHRDRVTFRADGRDALAVFSRGQRRILLLALHLLEGTLPTPTPRPAPLYLFDDILSELDPSRREAVRQALPTEQVVLTTADPAILAQFPPATLAYRVDRGTLSPWR